MFAMNLGKLNINEAELKAYIYQQLNDIQPYIGDDPVAIKMALTESGEFVVKMQYQHDGGEVATETTGEDIFSAISKAKTAFIRSLASLENAFEMEHEDDYRASVTTHVEKKTIH